MFKFSQNSTGSERQSFFKVAAALCFLMMMNPGSILGQSNQWTPKLQNGDIQSLAQIDTCAAQPGSFIFVKFINSSTTSDYEVNYELTVADDPTFPPVKGTVTVAAGTSETGNCNSPVFAGLRLPCGLGITSVNQLSVKFTLTSK